MARRHKLWGVALALVLSAAGAAIGAASQGRLETFGASRDPTAGLDGAPGWAAPCRRRPPRHDRELLARCARLAGRVVWVKSDEDHDVHLAVMADWRIVVVKVPPTLGAPGPLSKVEAVGALVRSRIGQREIDAVEVQGK